MSSDTDIAILGAGPTGLALALALRDGPWRVTVFDGAPAGQPAAADPRALALSEGTRQLLGRLDAWPAATVIRDIDISQQHGRTTTGLHATELGLDALGHVVRHGELMKVLRDRAAATGVAIESGRRASAIDPVTPERTAGSAATASAAGATDFRTIHFDDGAAVRARLVVHAEGTHDQASWQCDYAQAAIVCEVTPTVPHRQLAWERFTPDGPLALLPLDDRYAVVRVVPTARRAELLALDDAGFAAHLADSLGGRLAFSSVGPRSAFPLALRLRRALQREREVWIGNAAQTLHPVSGQGFNLGLRDAWTLAETLLVAADKTRHQPPNHLQKNSANAAFDPAHAALSAWARARQPDRYATAAFTDGIVRLFSNDLAPLRQARELGLDVLNGLPGLRNFVARRMIWGARGW